MEKYAVVSNISHADYIIKGENLKDAIRKNFKTIARNTPLGNAAGYHLTAVDAKYKSGILGARGGVELTIKHHGLKLAHKPLDTTTSISKVWIYCNDKTFNHKFI